MSKASTKQTTDHDEIKHWVESRGGFPATVKRTKDGDEPGILRIDFPGYSGENSLERIDWDAFFEKFEESELAMIYQEELKSGDESRFVKFISRK
jgi:hypothetical protein